MPFQLKENMIVAPICKREDVAKMDSEQREDFIRRLDQFVFDGQSDQVSIYQVEFIKSNKNAL